MTENKELQNYQATARRGFHIPPHGGLGGSEHSVVGGSFCLLSSAYFPPVQWFQKLVCYENVLIEGYDNYTKQTYRNRCTIATANGQQSLTVPIEGYEGNKCPMRDIRISSHGNWTHLHLHALMSAYGESPFFDYYIDDLRPFFEKPHTFLFDHNLAIVEKLCELLDIDPNISKTAHFIDAKAENIADYRDVIRPKKPLADPSFEPQPYYQVYAERHGFQPNLSVLDLLFNEGPEAVLHLQ